MHKQTVSVKLLRVVLLDGHVERDIFTQSDDRVYNPRFSVSEGTFQVLASFHTCIMTS